MTQVKKPGRVKGRGELYVRFDSLTLPNGVTRDFRGRIGSMDGNAKSEVDRSEGKVRSEGNKAGDARTIGEAAAAGTSVGVIAGGAGGPLRHGRGHRSRGRRRGRNGRRPRSRAVRTRSWPRARPSKWCWTGAISFDEGELNFGDYRPRAALTGPPADPSNPNRSIIPMPGRR